MRRQPKDKAKMQLILTICSWISSILTIIVSSSGLIIKAKQRSKMEDVYKSGPGICGYEPAGQYIYVNFTGIAKSADFRNVWNHALGLISRYNAKRWVINESQLNIMPEDREWHQKVWFVKSLEANPLDPEDPRLIALIMSKNFFMEFSTKQFIEQNSAPGFVINVFQDDEAAKAWVAQH